MAIINLRQILESQTDDKLYKFQKQEFDKNADWFNGTSYASWVANADKTEGHEYYIVTLRNIEYSKYDIPNEYTKVFKEKKYIKNLPKQNIERVTFVKYLNPNDDIKLLLDKKGQFDSLLIEMKYKNRFDTFKITNNNDYHKFIKYIGNNLQNPKLTILRLRYCVDMTTTFK